MQSHIILHQHASVTPVTNIGVSCDSTQLIVQKCMTNQLVTSLGVIIRNKFDVPGAENAKLVNTDLNTHFK